MAVVLLDIILNYIDDALDIDDLENLGDFVLSVIAIENLQTWQLTDVMRKLYEDLSQTYQTEKNKMRRARLKAALTHFEADFSEYLFSKETGFSPA